MRSAALRPAAVGPRLKGTVLAGLDGTRERRWWGWPVIALRRSADRHHQGGRREYPLSGEAVAQAAGVPRQIASLIDQYGQGSRHDKSFHHLGRCGGALYRPFRSGFGGGELVSLGKVGLWQVSADATLCRASLEYEDDAVLTFGINAKGGDRHREPAVARSMACPLFDVDYVIERHVCNRAARILALGSHSPRPYAAFASCPCSSCHIRSGRDTMRWLPNPFRKRHGPPCRFGSDCDWRAPMRS